MTYGRASRKSLSVPIVESRLIVKVLPAAFVASQEGAPPDDEISCTKSFVRERSIGQWQWGHLDLPLTLSVEMSQSNGHVIVSRSGGRVNSNVKGAFLSNLQFACNVFADVREPIVVPFIDPFTSKG